MKFYVGNEANASSHRDGIYIAIDTKKIFYNGDAYGGGDVDLSNYATKDDLKGYLPLTGGTMTSSASISIPSDDVEVYINNIDGFNLYGPSSSVFTAQGSNNSGLWSFRTILKDSDGNNIIVAPKGITISNKTSSDLLHAAGGTISIDELKSQLNIPDTSALQSAIGTNVYTGANYISKETNLTEAVLQLDTEIKATNDNLALEHTNAEAKYAKKSELDDYLPLAGGKLANSPYSSDYIQITPQGTGSGATPYIYISGQATTNEDDKFYIGIGRRFPGQLSSAGASILAETNFSQMIIDPKSGSITAFRKGTVEGVKETQYRYNGVYMVGKTPNDLLHANGGTISIQEILSQVTIPKATTSTLGGIKVGDGLEITSDGTLNCIIDPGSGSVSWGNITGKPSVFATNIASINDLNSGWDALLKAAPNIPSLDGYAKFSDLVSIYLSKTEASETYQPKGNYLTSVSWSQVSGKPSWIGSSKPSYTWSEIGSKPTFAAVATSGSYNDLTNKPNIPNVLAVNHSGTISLVIDSNTLSFKSDGIAFNGASIMSVPVVEVLSTEEINQILNS